MGAIMKLRMLANKIDWNVPDNGGIPYDLRKIADEMEAENTKLRELAKSAWGCVNRHVSCDECRMTCGGCTLQSAMRELGIEV